MQTTELVKTPYKSAKIISTLIVKQNKMLFKAIKTSTASIVKQVKSISKKLPNISSIFAFRLTKFKFSPRIATLSNIQSLKSARLIRKNRQVKVTQVVQATVIRQKKYGRLANVVVVYQIGTSKQRTFIRKTFATAVAIAKNIATRPFHIFVTEQATTVQTLASVSETMTNNVDTPGNYSNEVPLTPNDYNEQGITVPNDYNEPSLTPPDDFTEPDWPAGEDVVPT